MKYVEKSWLVIVVIGLSMLLLSCTPAQQAPDGRPLVVLTFDDAVQSHLDFVAPLLKEYGFSATFFVTYAWMDDTTHFMNWQDIATLSEMGFEIGNHSWTHANFSQPREAFELEGELIMMEWKLNQVGVPKPVSYAHTGNAFGPEAVQTLTDLGYKFARRGKQPEIAYGSLAGGPGYNPRHHHPLLIPTAIDFYPGMTSSLFEETLSNMPPDEIAVLQFHGVPDIAHPWVHTPQDDFRSYMEYLKEHNYRVISMSQLENHVPEVVPDDPLVTQRYPEPDSNHLSWPIEVLHSRKAWRYWVPIMQRHGFTGEEMSKVLGLQGSEVDSLLNMNPRLPPQLGERIEVWPYPGGRHPRIDFQDGMASARRGTKLSAFLPWADEEYVVLDVPEAVMNQFGIAFLGHKHIPTLPDLDKIQVDNIDWVQESNGDWKNLWKLPNQMEISAMVSPHEDRILMELSLTNHSRDTTFEGLQTQVCVMLGQTADFAEQTNDNKMLTCPTVAVKAAGKDRWIITGWQGCSHPWGNPDCPCLHADPSFPNCPPGETVTIRGILWFYEGKEVEMEINRKAEEYSWL